MNKFGYLLILLISSGLIQACSSKPYFVSMSKDKIGLSRIVDLYGEGAYFVFYSKYVMTDEEIESGYENYFAFTKNELKKTPICGNTYSIVRKSLSYYDEGGHVHILIKCD